MPTTTIFSPDQLSAIVAETLPGATDATHHNAIVGSVDLSGAQVIASFTRPQGSAIWQFEAAARHDWTGTNEVGAKVILKW